MIKIKNLTFVYDNCKTKALDNITLNIEDGEFVGIIGPTGAGKTTLTFCLNGVVPHFNTGDFYGSVLINGKDTVDNTCGELAYDIGSVFQDPESQVVCTNVLDEIAFGMENQGFEREEMKKRVEESLCMVGISHLFDRSVDSLSGGQLQRVSIAAAIALKPSIIILDEPTSELDPDGSYEIFNILKKLNEEYKITVIVVEQKLRLLSEYCNRLIVLNEGRIVLDDTTKNVLTQYKELELVGINTTPLAKLHYLLIQQGLIDCEVPLNIHEAKKMIESIYFINNRRWIIFD